MGTLSFALTLTLSRAAGAADPALPTAPDPRTQSAPLTLATSPAPNCPDNDRPPNIQRVIGARDDQRGTIAAIGRQLVLTLDVVDPEGAPLRVSAFGVPEGAQFSEELRTLTWTPSARERGMHSIRFVVSDGCKEQSRVLSLQVAENRAPFFQTTERSALAGQLSQISLAASDPDGDSLTYTVAGLEPGATFDPLTAVLAYRPGPDDEGKHTLRVTASDGTLSATEEFTIDVQPPQSSRARREWSSFLLPGLGYSVYSPREREIWGRFHGVALELLLAAWIHRNDNRGPSHGRVYVSAEVLQSTRDDVSLLFSYALGFSLSLERNPHRTFLIPNYGLDLGGIIHDGIGGHLQATPYVGLHLYSNPNVFLSARLGYRLVPSELERYGGMHASVGGDFSVW